MRWLVFLAACGASQTPAAPTSIIGVWGVEMIAPQTSGHLELHRTGTAWTATIAGKSATLQLDDGWLHADLGTGEVRLDPKTNETYWLQGGGTFNNLAYATPLAVHATADAITAEVTPLPDQLRLYLDITSPTTAFIREPGRNLGHFLGALTIARAGDQLTFTGKDRVVAHAKLAGATMHVDFDGADIAVDLTKRDRATAPGFYPRTETQYTPHAPTAGDGWEVASLASVGMRAEPIAQWMQAIIDGVPTSAESPAIHSIVITRHGKLVVEEYFDGYTAATPHDTRSAGKSWGTTLAGIAVDRGELALTTAVDERTPPITLAHVVSMTTGLDCDDHDDASPGNEDTMQQQKAEKDWYRFMLALKSIRAPGEKGVYCSGAINLDGYLIARATHEWLPARFVRQLGVPLEMRDYYVDLMPTEQGYLGGGLQMRARDFAKLPQLFLDHGVWHGKQIVSADWVTRATAAHTSLTNPDDYGYGWWRTTYHVDGRPYAAFYASGNGGQLAIAIPELDVVVSIMSGNYQNFPTWKHFVEDDVPRYVIGAITPVTPERSR